MLNLLDPQPLHYTVHILNAYGVNLSLPLVALMQLNLCAFILQLGNQVGVLEHAEFEVGLVHCKCGVFAGRQRFDSELAVLVGIRESRFIGSCFRNQNNRISGRRLRLLVWPAARPHPAVVPFVVPSPSLSS